MPRSLAFRLALTTAVLALCALPAQAAMDASTCAECHPDVVAGMSQNIHMRLSPFEVQGRAVACEGCHGDATKHIETGEDILRFDAEGGAQDACLSCHSTHGLSEWRASTHASEDVACADCHAVHSAAEPLDACSTCHSDVEAQFRLPSHHPVREGKMSCSSCHDPHTANEFHLKTAQRTNELCYECHQDKEGPFIFEHSPVQEACDECHTPHGAVANRLLAVNEPMLCLQCHDLHFHSGYRAADGEVDVGGFERESPLGAFSFNAAFTTRCTQCHARIHGSDNPSQSLTGGGSGFTR